MMIDKNKTCYVFDVDGTLTEPRKVMSDEFIQYFLKWAKHKQLFIATGSDFKKTREQLPQEILDCFKLIFCCMCNEIRSSDGTIITKNNFQHSERLESFLEDALNSTNYNTKTGRHLEYRTGMVNFSIVGRNANSVQRSEYKSWDDEHLERKEIAKNINKYFSDYQASVGGSISIDIIMQGKDKRQAIEYLQGIGAEKVVFCGDKCFPGGNDYGIIQALIESDLAYEWYQIHNPNQLMNLMKTNKVFV